MTHPNNEIYLVLKRNELPSHERTRKELKCTLISESSDLKEHETLMSLENDTDIKESIL
jgi:hypothetical protein